MEKYALLMPPDLAAEVAGLDGVTEIRLRVGRPMSVAVFGAYRHIGRAVNSADIDRVLALATDHSVYASDATLAQGYLTCDGGIRIGVCGECVYKNGRLAAYRKISSLCMRVPHEVEFSDARLESLLGDFGNTLIVSPPGRGKTTLLRYMIKRMSENGRNVLAIDERNELSASVDGIATADLGPNTDIVLYAGKTAGYAEAVRAMRPDLIATDELFGKEEVACIADAVRCGVGVMATVHADSAVKVLENEIYGALGRVMRYYVLLEGLGRIAMIYDKERENCIR